MQIEYIFTQILFQKFLARSDLSKSGDISLAEFIHYIKEHEKNLRLQFSDLDKNQDGENEFRKILNNSHFFRWNWLTAQSDLET